MNKETIRKAILDIIAEIAPDEVLDAIDDGKTLRDQFNLDSMDFLDIVMELRKRFNIEVPEEDYEHLTTLTSTVTYLEPMMKNQVYS